MQRRTDAEDETRIIMICLEFLEKEAANCELNDISGIIGKAIRQIARNRDKKREDYDVH